MKKQFLTNRSKAISAAKRLAGPRVIKLLKKAGLNSILKNGQTDYSQTDENAYKHTKTQLTSSISVENKPRPLEMSRLVADTLPIDKITLVRDESFFHWRYNNPLSKYRFFYWCDHEMKGYLVLQNHIYGVESIGSYNLFELEATTPQIKIELLKAMISIMKDGAISVWKNMLDQDSYEYLVSKGFREESIRESINTPARHMLIRPIGKHNDKIEFQGLNLLDENNWDFKMIYMHDH